MAKKERSDPRLPVKTRDDDKVATILAEAVERSALAHGWWDTNYKASKQEVAFNAGRQWSAELVQQRTLQQRPTLTINTLPQFIDQVVGDFRQNRMSIHVSSRDAFDTPVTGDSAGDGKPPRQLSMAEVFEGMIRHIEYRSNAQAHYTRSFQHAVDGAIGWLRVVTKWEMGKSFDQEAFITSVRNRWSVLMDGAAEEPDLSDANYGFVFSFLPEKEFERQYPKGRKGAITSAALSRWYPDGQVAVAEYFRREPVERELVMTANGEMFFDDEVDVAQMEEQGVIRARRKFKSSKVIWCKITAHSLLEGPVEWPGSTIPLVPVFGKSFDLEDGPEYRGLTRPAHDAKRMHNYWTSAATETVALAPKAPWLLTPAMIAGHESMWENSNSQNQPYLLWNPDDEVGGQGPSRPAPPTPAVADLNLMLTMTDQVKQTVGMYNASVGEQSNETSGKAIMARQREGDVGAFAFNDNMNFAIQRVGKILLEIIPRVYDTERRVSLRSEDGDTDLMTINKVVGTETGEEVVVNDLTRGTYDLVVTSGPSYTTQRQEAAEALIELLRAVPSIAPYVLDKAVRMQDWPNAQAIADRLRFIVPRHALDEQEQADVPEPQPTPEQQAEMAQAEADMAKAKADTAMAEAKTMEAQAKMAEIEAMARGGDAMAQTIRAIVLEVLQEMRAANNTSGKAKEPTR